MFCNVPNIRIYYVVTAQNLAEKVCQLSVSAIISVPIIRVANVWYPYIQSTGLLKMCQLSVCAN